MRTLLLLALLFCACSCEVSGYKSVNARYENGQLISMKMVTEPLIQWGGQRSTARADGSSTVNNYEASFQHFCQMIGASVLSWSQAGVAKARSLADQFYAGQITKREAARGMEAIRLREIAAQEATTNTAIGAGAEIAPVTVVPPGS